MKISFFLLSFQIMLLSINFSSELYKCGDDLKIDACMLVNTEISGDKKETTIYVKACSKGKVCQSISGEREISFCVKKDKFIKDGKSCKVSAECESNNCINGKCAYIQDGNQCESDDNCDKGSYCKGNEDEIKVCAALGDVGAQCNYDSNCKIGLMCNIYQSPSICTEMFSLKDGDESSEEFLCQSGVTINGVCASTTSVNTTCDDNHKCKITYTESNMNVNEDINCLNDEIVFNYLYCPVQSNSDKLKNYIDVYKKELNQLKDDDINDIHVSTINRYSLNNNKKVLEAFVEYKYSYVFNDNNDDCIKDFFIKYEKDNQLKLSFYLFVLLVVFI